MVPTAAPARGACSGSCCATLDRCHTPRRRLPGRRRRDFRRTASTARCGADHRYPPGADHEWYWRRRGCRAYWRRVKGRRQPDWYSYGAAGWEILSLSSQAPHGRRSPAALAARPSARRQRRLPARLRCRPATAPASCTATRPTWRRSGTRCAAARLVLGGHEHNLRAPAPPRGILWCSSSGPGADPALPLRPGDGRLRLGTGRPRRRAADRADTPGRVTLELPRPPPGCARPQLLALPPSRARPRAGRCPGSPTG